MTCQTSSNNSDSSAMFKQMIQTTREGHAMLTAWGLLGMASGVQEQLLQCCKILTQLVSELGQVFECFRTPLAVLHRHIHNS